MKAVCKKLLSLVLVAILLISAVPFQANAADLYVEVEIRKDGSKVGGEVLEPAPGSVTVDGALIQKYYSAYDSSTMSASWSKGDGLTMTPVAAGSTITITEDVLIVCELTTEKDEDDTIIIVPPVKDEEEEEEDDTPVVTPPADDKEESKPVNPPVSPDGESNPIISASSCNLTIIYNLSDAPTRTVKATKGTAYSNYVGEPARGGYTFLGWFSSSYNRFIDVTKDVIREDDTIEAMWSGAKKFNLTLDENRGQTETVNRGLQVSYGEKIFDRVYAYKPTREGYVFIGWSLNGKIITKDTVYDLQSDATAYAVWEDESIIPGVPNFPEKDGNVYLEIYANGNTTTPVKRIKMNKYAADGYITRAEAKEAASPYIKVKTGYTLSYNGLFDEEAWYWFCMDPETDGTDKVKVDLWNDHYVYVMVNNVKVTQADSTNPKTGDMIFATVSTMVSSAAAAAYLFLNKKRFVK